MLETELPLVARCFPPAVLQQIVEHRLVQLPWAVLVGIGQGRALGRFVHPQMPQFPFAGGQTARDFAQALRMSELAEQHGDQLGPTAEAAGMPFGFMLPDFGLERQARDELQDLAENAAYSIHGGSLRVVDIWFFARIQIQTTVASASIGSPPSVPGTSANLDETGAQIAFHRVSTTPQELL